MLFVIAKAKPLKLFENHSVGIATLSRKAAAIARSPSSLGCSTSPATARIIS